ncbi:Vng6393h (plasmid) [Halobacterium salinarum NRC-1]|uniref:Spurious ORF n=1 Tax=Halobacterium salinarum (strain ATCC 700922 / JCM 11081 / NRC-1) TaxID=64091 RepID=Q9HHH6_HALSA|nr:Vng6393h [Halobacterium salinarum NRC-1]DAC79973.1 TPA_inf: spurious ORF [Halobacterium salinarum NRC-1]
MLGRDRPDRGFDWFSHPNSGLRGRVVGERERFVAAVPLLDEIVFLAGIRRRRRWERFVLEVVEDCERRVVRVGLLLAFDPLDKRLVAGFLEREPVLSSELPEAFVFVLVQFSLHVLGVVAAHRDPSCYSHLLVHEV